MVGLSVYNAGPFSSSFMQIHEKLTRTVCGGYPKNGPPLQLSCLLYSIGYLLTGGEEEEFHWLEFHIESHKEEVALSILTGSPLPKAYQ